LQDKKSQKIKISILTVCGFFDTLSGRCLFGSGPLACCGRGKEKNMEFLLTIQKI
jgi:hypothetical protein